MKTCTQCGETKPLEMFNRDRRSPDGRRAQCSVCSAAYQRQRMLEPHKRAMRNEWVRQRRHAAAPVKAQRGREMLVTDEEIALCLPQGIAGRIVGHVIAGRIVYDRRR
jgi:hypothetical protein